MIVMLLRDLLFILFCIGFIYWLYKMVKKVLIRNETEEAVEDVKETMHLAEGLPKISDEKVKEAKQKINKVIKQGE